MADLFKANQLATDSGFIDRVSMAAVEAALNVATEDPGTTNHINRATLAQQVLRSPQGWGKTMAMACAVNGTINSTWLAGDSIPDGDIGFVIASIWDAFAGSGPVSE